MENQKELHLTRLRESLGAIKSFREKNLTPFDPAFRSWKDRTQQSLEELFGRDHNYLRRFSSLHFSEVRLIVSMRPGGHRQWSGRDQETFESNLEEAHSILTDALEEFPIREKQARSAPTTPFERPQIVVNVVNVLSQSTHVELGQILSTLDSLGLQPDDLFQAKNHAEKLAEETAGEQRWPILAKSLDALKSMGKSVYENVALPLLLEMLKKQAGLSS